jgi:hypothetical protein
MFTDAAYHRVGCRNTSYSVEESYMPGRRRKQPEEPIENPIDDPSVFLTNPDEFPDGEDPVADRFAEAENDPRVEDLRDRNPGPVDPGRFATPQQMPDGTWQRPDSDNIGRPVMVPLWEHAHIYPSVTQLRVWRSVNGNLHEIGAIACKSNMEEFIETFWHSMPKDGENAGLFEARAMDAQGNFVGKVFQIGPIDSNHITLRRMRAAKAGAAQLGYQAPPIVQSGLDLNLLAAIKEMFVNPALEQARLAQEEARHAREARDAEARRIADERISLAQNTGATVQEMSTQLLRTAADADQRRASEQTQFFTAQQLLEKADRDRERVRVEEERKIREDERKREREEAEDKRKAEREEAEAKRKADREEAEEKRKIEREEREEARKNREAEYARQRSEEREREDRRRKEEQDRADERKRDDEKRWERERSDAAARESERESSRKREHEERIAQLEIRAKQDQEHQVRMMQLSQKDSPEGAIGSLNKMLAPLGMDVKELAVPFIQRMMNPEAEFDIAGLVEGVGKVAVDGFGKLVDYAKTMKAIEAQKAGVGGGHPVMGQQQITQVQQQQAPQQPGNAAQAATPPAGTPVVEPAHTASSLPLDMQRACRAALRQAVNEMRQTPEDKWPDTVSKAFATEPGLFHWFKQLTIRGALRDIQVEAAFIEHILNHPAMNNPLLSEVPRG